MLGLVAGAQAMQAQRTDRAGLIDNEHMHAAALIFRTDDRVVEFLQRIEALDMDHSGRGSVDGRLHKHAGHEPVLEGNIDIFDRLAADLTRLTEGVDAALIGHQFARIAVMKEALCAQMIQTPAVMLTRCGQRVSLGHVCVAQAFRAQLSGKYSNILGSPLDRVAYATSLTRPSVSRWPLARSSTRALAFQSARIMKPSVSRQ